MLSDTTLRLVLGDASAFAGLPLSSWIVAHPDLTIFWVTSGLTVTRPEPRNSSH
jgi:hypothetical protein